MRMEAWERCCLVGKKSFQRSKFKDYRIKFLWQCYILHGQNNSYSRSLTQDAFECWSWMMNREDLFFYYCHG